jgi:hypothetical protein
MNRCLGIPRQFCRTRLSRHAELLILCARIGFNP